MQAPRRTPPSPANAGLASLAFLRTSCEQEPMKQHEDRGVQSRAQLSSRWHFIRSSLPLPRSVTWRFFHQAAALLLVIPRCRSAIHFLRTQVSGGYRPIRLRALDTHGRPAEPLTRDADASRAHPTSARFTTRLSQFLTINPQWTKRLTRLSQ